jgi:hypothetical protein
MEKWVATTATFVTWPQTDDGMIDCQAMPGRLCRIVMHLWPIILTAGGAADTHLLAARRFTANTSVNDSAEGREISAAMIVKSDNCRASCPSLQQPAVY